MKPRLPGLAIGSKTLDYEDRRLRNDFDVADNNNNKNNEKRD